MIVFRTIALSNLAMRREASLRLELRIVFDIVSGLKRRYLESNQMSNML